MRPGNKPSLINTLPLTGNGERHRLAILLENRYYRRVYRAQLKKKELGGWSKSAPMDFGETRFNMAVFIAALLSDDRVRNPPQKIAMA
jgi:hypothetical protein